MIPNHHHHPDTFVERSMAASGKKRFKKKTHTGGRGLTERERPPSGSHLRCTHWDYCSASHSAPFWPLTTPPTHSEHGNRSCWMRDA
eukprot:scaffold47_cov112-Isochrysis_galbana.AAC.15